MIDVSVIIPSRNEQFLVPTIKGLVSSSKANTEIIVVLEGYWPDEIVDDKKVHYIHFSKPRGMRTAINAGAAISRGKFLMKLDAHCKIAEGFDTILMEDCDQDWIVVPRRYSLDAENWKRNPKGPTDYHFLQCPLNSQDGALHGKIWNKRRDKRRDILIEDEMCSTGSCWFMSKRHFDWLGGLHLEGYGDFIQEFQELGMKTWLGGGQVKINKKTWYAHLHKGRKYGRGYKVSKSSWHQGCYYSADLWLNNKWNDRIHDMGWLIEKFEPVPTWPDNWRELWDGSNWTREIGNV